MKTVPYTKLRALYESLSLLSLSTKTQKSIMIDLLRQNNYKRLIKLYVESYEHIERNYDNTNEPIYNQISNRKPLKESNTIKSTNDITYYFETFSNISISPSKYDFNYIQREVSPLRTKNAIKENGLSAKSSGTGGIDFIGWNTSKNIPVLGEIKVYGDQNPFYALIQLLTYLSEISSPKQIERINNFKHFGNDKDLSSDTKFYLYIVSCRNLDQKHKYYELLPDAMKLAENIAKEIDKIEDILFFHLDPITKVITQEL